MIACNVVHMLCLVQASFNGVDVELVAWEHLLVGQESDFGGQVKKMSLWSRFGCALWARGDFGELQSGLLAGCDAGAGVLMGGVLVAPVFLEDLRAGAMVLGNGLALVWLSREFV